MKKVAVFALRILDRPATEGIARGFLRNGEDGGRNGIFATMTGVFDDLPSGPLGVSLWVRVVDGSAKGAIADPGCFNASLVTITEM